MTLMLLDKIDQLIDDTVSNEEKERRKQLLNTTKAIATLKNSLLSLYNLKLLGLYKFTSNSSMLTTVKQNDLLIFGYCRRHCTNISGDIVDYIIKYYQILNITMIMAGRVHRGELNTDRQVNGNILITEKATLGFASMRSDIPIPIKSQHRKYYYEFIVRGRSLGIAQIGFCDDYCFPDGHSNGVGDDAHSWAFDGGRVKKWHDRIEGIYGTKWGFRDIVGCCIEIYAHTKTCDIGFYLNGTYLGIAFQQQKYSGNLYPACSFQCGRYGQESMYYGTLIFAEGQLKFTPAGYQPVI